MGNPLRIPQRTAPPKHAWVTKPEESREQVGTGGTGMGKATRSTGHFFTFSRILPRPVSTVPAGSGHTSILLTQSVPSLPGGGWEKGCWTGMPGQRVPWELCSLGGDFVSWHDPATTKRGWSGRLGVRLAPSGWVSLTEHARRHGTGNMDRMTQWATYAHLSSWGSVLPSPRKREILLYTRKPFLGKSGPSLFRMGKPKLQGHGPSWGFPARVPCLLRFPTSLPTSHRFPGPTQASGPGLGPPRRRGTGGERRRRRGSGVGRRLPRAAVGGLFRGEEPARGRIAPRRRLPAPVPRPSSRPGARAPTPGAAPRFSPSTEPAPQVPLRALPPLGDPHAHPPPPGRLGYSNTSRGPAAARPGPPRGGPAGRWLPPPPFLGSVPGERGREARRSSPRARKKQRVPTGPAREREREPVWGEGSRTHLSS